MKDERQEWRERLRIRVEKLRQQVQNLRILKHGMMACYNNDPKHASN